LVQGEVDERGRDGVALLQQDVGELHHGDEEARVQDDRRLHGLCFFFPGCFAGLDASKLYMHNLQYSSWLSGRRRFVAGKHIHWACLSIAIVEYTS